MKKYTSPEIEVFTVTSESPLADSPISGSGRNDRFDTDDSFDWD